MPDADLTPEPTPDPSPDLEVLVQRLGGGLLVAVGLLLVTGLWDTLTAMLRSAVSGFVPAI